MGGRLKFFGSGLFASVATFGLVFCFANLFSLFKSTENENQQDEIVFRARRDVAKNDEDARIKFPGTFFCEIITTFSLELFDGTYSYNTWSPNWSKTTPKYEIRSNSSATPSIWKDEFDPVNDDGSSFSSSSVSEYKTEEILNDSWRELCKVVHGQSCSTFKLSPNEQFIVGQESALISTRIIKLISAQLSNTFHQLSSLSFFGRALSSAQNSSAIYFPAQLSFFGQAPSSALLSSTIYFPGSAQQYFSTAQLAQLFRTGSQFSSA